MPLDVTKKLILTKDLVSQMCKAGKLSKDEKKSQLGKTYPLDERGKAMFLTDLAQFLIKSNMGFRCTQGTTGFLVHDASTLAFLFYPETIRFNIFCAISFTHFTVIRISI